MYSISYRAEKRLSVTERTVRMDVGPEDTHHSYLCQSNGHLYLPTVRRIESFIKELRERAERLTSNREIAILSGQWVGDPVSRDLDVRVAVVSLVPSAFPGQDVWGSARDRQQTP